MKYYKLEDAVKAAKMRTKGTNNILYIYSQPSINGLFVDWIVEGMKYTDKTPTVIVKAGKAEHKRD